MLSWTVAPGTESCTATGLIASEPVLSYALPVINPGSLRLNDSAVVIDVHDQVLMYLPNTVDQFWVTFNGTFGHYPQYTNLRYSSSNGYGFACELYDEATDSTGLVDPSVVICLTAGEEPAGKYRFTVDIDGHSSLPGEDLLISPQLQISSVYGCRESVGNATAGCRTTGGEVITIAGEGLLFAEGMVLTRQFSCYLLCDFPLFMRIS